jgi:hypothetical protein
LLRKQAEGQKTKAQKQQAVVCHFLEKLSKKSTVKVPVLPTVKKAD